MDNVMEKVKELSDKAAKWDNMKGKYKSYAEKLVQARNLIQEVVAELDPISGVKVREASGINYEEIAAEIYEKMQQGLEVSISLLMNTYPQLDDSKAHYLMAYICNHHKDIDSRREFRNKLIYCRREHK
jgi:hypothetical protein